MSLSQLLTKNIEKVIESYAENIAEKYGLDKMELLTLWGSEMKSQTTSKLQTELGNIDIGDISLSRLNKCNKAELVALCKSKGCKCTGTKDVLIQRLLEQGESPVKKTVGESKTKKAVIESKSKKASNDVIEKLTKDIPVIPIRRNEHGNLVHPETGLVFDRKTETVIGKQEDDGTIADLTDEDIQECKRFKFKFCIPNNLDKKDNLKNIKIQELENDSDIEVVEDEEVEDEEVEIEDDEEVEIEDEDD